MIDILGCHLIDLTHITHECVSEEDCLLPHTHKIVDRVNHFFQEYEFMFQSVGIILIEEQPYKGVASAVEAMIFNRWRTKCQHIRPLDMLHHYGYRHYTYEHRKKISVHLAQQVLTNMGLLDLLDKFERKHDCSDAILMACFFLENKGKQKRKRIEEEENKKKKEHDDVDIKDFSTFIDQFRYRSKETDLKMKPKT